MAVMNYQRSAARMIRSRGSGPPKDGGEMAMKKMSKSGMAKASAAPMMAESSMDAMAMEEGCAAPENFEMKQ